jgi:3'(2'), 5'-bisphosphate nucleotidase
MSGAPPRHSANDLEELAAGALAAARLAAVDIMAVYAGGFAVERKEDESPVTAADLASHRILESALARLDPAVLAITEESKTERKAERHAARCLWLVDPLDGTREFVKRNGEFCIAIALIDDGRVRLGLLLHPPTGTIWQGIAGCGAERIEADGSRRALAVARPYPQPPRAAASRSHGNPVVEDYLARLGPIDRVPQGSALKFGLLAEGRIDIYARLASRCSEWDVAAGQCIVEQAGGQVVDERGEPLRYNRRESLIVPNFLAYGDPAGPWLEALDGIEIHDR